MAQLRERLTTGRVAEMFAVDVSTIKRWASTGKIPAHVLPSGRFVYFLDEIEPLVPGYEPVQHREAGRVDVQLVVAVLAVAVALTLGLNAVGPHVQASLVVLSLAIGVGCGYLVALLAGPRAGVQPRRARRGGLVPVLLVAGLVAGVAGARLPVGPVSPAAAVEPITARPTVTLPTTVTPTLTRRPRPTITIPGVTPTLPTVRPTSRPTVTLPAVTR